MNRSLTLFLLFFTLLMSLGAYAETKNVYREISPDQIIRLATAMEITATHGKPQDGSPRLELDYGTYQASLIFHDCVIADQCGSLQFSSTIALQQAVAEKTINAWNDNGVFARAHLTESGHAVLSWDYSLRTGTTVESLAYTLVRFNKLIATFVEFAQKADESSTAPE